VKSRYVGGVGEYPLKEPEFAAGVAEARVLGNAVTTMR